MTLPTGYPCIMELKTEICWTKSQKSPLSHEGSAGFEKPGYYTMKPNPEGFSGLTRILLGPCLRNCLFGIADPGVHRVGRSIAFFFFLH